MSSAQVNPADGENFVSVVEMTFVFSMIWSVCASVDEEGRKRIDSCLREMEGSFPNKVRPQTQLCQVSRDPAVSPPAVCEPFPPGPGRANDGFGSLSRLPSLGHGV